MLLSVVIPAYNEESMIGKAAEETGACLVQAGIPFEILFVDDGSRDATWQRIADCASGDGRIRGISFSRNFGKEAAIMAGLAAARGDCVAVMDCDLQHPPKKLAEMVEQWKAGAEIVDGIKETRGKESFFYGLFSRFFYGFMQHATGVDMTHASDFKLLDRKVVAVLLQIRERQFFFRAATEMIGFRRAQVRFDVGEREGGGSKWSRSALIRYAITNMTSYTAVPMRVVLYLGILMLLLSFFLGGEALYRYITGEALGGFTTVILLQLIIGSITMLSLGMIGYYIARIFDEVRIRPGYVISRETNMEAMPAGEKETAD